MQTHPQPFSGQPPEENLHYAFKDGRYSFFAFGREISHDLPTVAVLFDHKHRVIINHGNPVFVRERFKVVQRMYIDSGLASDDVVLLEGCLPVDMLNTAINNPGRIGDLYAEIQAVNALRADEVVQALMSRMARGSAFATTGAR
jgi:hypothetical protein